MKTVREFLPCMTIEQFAEENDLVMEVKERSVNRDSSMRYYASFQYCCIRSESNFSFTYADGNGNTPEEAIMDYIKKIEVKTLFFGWYAPHGVDKRKIKVPRLVMN